MACRPAELSVSEVGCSSRLCYTCGEMLPDGCIQSCMRGGLRGLAVGARGAQPPSWQPHRHAPGTPSQQTTGTHSARKKGRAPQALTWTSSAGTGSAGPFTPTATTKQAKRRGCRAAPKEREARGQFKSTKSGRERRVRGRSTKTHCLLGTRWSPGPTPTHKRRCLVDTEEPGGRAGKGRRRGVPTLGVPVLRGDREDHSRCSCSTEPPPRPCPPGMQKAGAGAAGRRNQRAMLAS